jgi:hypothetical protein
MLQNGVKAVYIEVQGWFHRLSRVGSVEVDGWAATTWLVGHVLSRYYPICYGFFLAASWRS